MDLTRVHKKIAEAHFFLRLMAGPLDGTKMILVDCASWLSRAFRAIGVLVAAILFSAVPNEAPGQQPQENPFARFDVSWADRCGTVDSDDWCESIIYINGEITVQTAERFEKALRQVHQHRQLFIVLDSLGGSVSAAMRIGRLIRNTGGRTVVGSGATCASACVLVFAAGLSRVVGARILNPSLILPGASKPLDFSGLQPLEPAIGIHRPALADAPPETDMTSVKTAAERVEKELREYAGEMNISPRLIDDMLATPPEQVRWLSEQERQGYGLGFLDPVYAETASISESKKYKIKPSQYRVRNAEALYACKNFLNPDDEFGFLESDNRSWCVKDIIAGSLVVPAGFVLDVMPPTDGGPLTVSLAPPCKNGAQTCEPWERDWGTGAPPKGAVVTKHGTIFQSPSRP